MSLGISSVSAYSYAQPATAGAAGRNAAGKAAGNSGKMLTPEEQATVDKLKARDRHVRQHEAAHQAAAGGLAVSGANFTYERGPDGQNYAVGGEVRISVSKGRTPEETLSRAQTIHAAALAPSDPSGQDRAVAAEADRMAMEARAEMAQENGPTGKDGQRGNKVSQVYGNTGNTENPAGKLISAYA